MSTPNRFAGRCDRCGATVPALQGRCYLVGTRKALEHAGPCPPRPRELTSDDLRALTLHRPWSWAVSHEDKNIENRDWPPPEYMLGRYVAIHAGKKWDEAAAEKLRAFFPGVEITEETIPSSRIVAVAKVLGYVCASDVEGFTAFRGVSSDTARAAVASRWFVGSVGWLLGPRIVLPEPVVCRGAQGLWRLQDADFNAVARQLGDLAP